MEKVNFDIPKISGDLINLSLGMGDRLFVVGANGSGKSALMHHLALNVSTNKIKRITAHRQTSLNSGTINFTPAQRTRFSTNYLGYNRSNESRYLDNYAGEEQSAILFDLDNQYNVINESIANHHRNQDIAKASETALKSPSPFDQINELLNRSRLNVELERTEDRRIIANHSQGWSFDITQMSDGERSAMIIAGHVITAEPETVFLIDEPEKHLHRSISQPFLSALFDLRKDCAFIISTHEIDLAIANPEARVLMLRSCKWSGDQCIAWDAEDIKPNSELPEDSKLSEELKRTILGYRKRILFVEGNADSSLDLPLYRILFPNISIVPRGSCGEVEKTVLELMDFQGIHDVEAFGLIDRDDRPCEDVKRLAKKGVFALEVYSVEALYYCSEAIAAVAHQQANSLGVDVNELVESVKKNVFEMLRTRENIAKEMAARRCLRQIRKTTLSAIPKWESVIDNPTQAISVSIDLQPYCNELKRFKKLVDEEKLDQLIARYRLHKSPILSKIATTLKCPGREDYERMVLVQIQQNSELVEKLKERISQLSEVLDSPEK